MSQEPENRALDALTEAPAHQIIFPLAPGATSDLLTAVKHLLYSLFDNALVQMELEWSEEITTNGAMD